MLWEVKGKIDVDIDANPSQECGEEDEGFDDTAVKVVDIVDTFRLQEQPSFDKKQFVTYIKRYIKLLTPKLEWEKQELFKSTLSNLPSFCSQSSVTYNSLLVKACMMMVVWSLPITRRVLLIQHFCTLPTV
ncbi:unnamed protein product [Musa hybrid cultivar]